MSSKKHAMEYRCSSKTLTQVSDLIKEINEQQQQQSINELLNAKCIKLTSQ